MLAPDSSEAHTTLGTSDVTGFDGEAFEFSLASGEPVEALNAAESVM
jgi:hypothetical protein